jgi:hypothetical protein
MCVIEYALNSGNAGAYEVNKHTLSSHLVVEFLEWMSLVTLLMLL